jgi:hypothetical protein
VSGTPVTIAAGTAAGTTSSNATATCTTGKQLVGGGATIIGNVTAQVSVLASSWPSTAGVNGTWSANATVVTKTGAGAAQTLTAFALCA